MTIFQINDEPEITQVLKGIYPILNIDPKTDIHAMLDWAVNLPDAGIKLVQVRAKMIEKNALPQLLDEVVNHLKGAGLRVIINDYAELVKITGADGVHLGYEDFPIFEARAILGHSAIVGATVRHFGEALQASGQGASYIAAGSVYESGTKSGIPVIGIDELKGVHQHLIDEGMPRLGWGRFDHVPICAIGGINKNNLKEVYDAGASMAAVIGSVQGSDDPLKSAEELVKAWESLQHGPESPCYG